ncbi:MAG TPA: SURF1 family protein [Propionibacteriaceae bacterium]|nr:SURF1 family protein [Propionibacteriaceae bacterium]
MQRLWLRWAALLLFVAVLGTVFVNLGEWQLRRLEQRKEHNATQVTNEQRPVADAATVFTRPIGDADQWQRVQARGTFDPDHQFVIRYRNNGDARGYEVVTPLRTARGWLLVDRGFVAVERGVEIPTTAPPPPSGEVTVVGHLRRSEQGRRGAVQPVAGQVRLINAAALQTALPYPVPDGYLGLLTVQPPQTGNLAPVLPPELSSGPHFWYAVQWFMFTGLAVLGIVVFIRGDLRARREAAGSSPLVAVEERRYSV